MLRGVMACSGMMQECPLLVRLNQEGTLYDGFITVRERDFRLHVALPPDGQVRNARLHCSWQLKQALRGHQALVKQRLEQSQSLEDFIVELKMILETSLRSKRALHAPPPPSYYSRLIGEIEALGWETLTFIDPNFSTIGFSFWDTSGRPHTITLNLKPQYPVEAPECLVDIPVTFDLHWTPQSSLATMQSHFLTAVEALKDFWDTMDEIDRNTWVLEPEKPSRASTTRRIAIGNSASLHLEVDPQHPKTFPECRFLGADHVVTPLRNKLSANMHHWHPEASVLHNLLHLLEIELPSPATHNKADFSMECGICYAYRLEGAIPDQVCDEPRCGQPFHQACLYEWLRSLPSCTQSFNVVFGKCPYCSKPITLKLGPNTT
ncbi:E3 ubiquitin-protein ligase FANCL isoform X1 [Petromyzon marinus]|uniref:E3 ubiquitin-protein ligase FANCL isoform X1 n=2 Tax=Petromyzon marinus TaxID=7757 RepID=A0AAJ7STS1_PETMA|nr:E3 ubiquitin-protein ligase FANCL isoform X1 [Petromyzon marinus]